MNFARGFCFILPVGMFKLSNLKYWPKEELPPLQHSHHKETSRKPPVVRDKFDDQRQHIFDVLLLLNEQLDTASNTSLRAAM